MKRRDFANPALQGLRQRLLPPEAASQLDKGVVHIGREFGNGTVDFAPTVPVPAEQERETCHQIADFRDQEERPCPRTKGRDALGFQRGDVGPAVFLAYAVKQQGDLVVVLNDPVFL